MKKYQLYSKTLETIPFEPTALYEHYVGQEIGFLLESFDKGQGRYSFLAKDPYEIITSTNQGLRVQGKEGTKEIQGHPIESLKNYMNQYQVINSLDLPFEGGLVGAFSYDYVRYIEELPHQNEDELDLQPIQLFLVYSFICMDHLTEEITAVVLEATDEEGKQKAELQLNAMAEAIKSVKPMNKHSISIPDGRLIKKSDEKEDYIAKVEKAKHYIKEGHIFQVALSQRWCIESSQEGFDVFKDLRVLNPSPYLYYFNYGTFEVIGSSPELLVKKIGRQITTCPIAGTRRRGKDAAEDDCLEKELLADEKERAEHVMLVDLARNDMGKVAEFNSVKVTRFMEVHHYSHVMHIVSYVEGTNTHQHALDILSAFLPAGTLSGAPKIRAMEIIDELENVQRGLYAGAIGYIGFNGNMDFCITIRTLIKKGQHYYLQAGAGLVADSVPELEYEECQHKARALSKILLKEGETIDSINR